MYLSIFFLLMSWTASGQPVNFTINRIDLQALPSSTIRNGETLRLRCAVDIAKTTDFELTSTFYFYKDDHVIYNVTATNTHAIYIIQNASVSRTGLYRCQIQAEKRQKMSEEIKVRVTGLFAPLITVSKTEVREGDEITVRCEAPNEEPPMYFNFYKTGKERAPVKARNSADNKMETKYEIKEGESILHFECAIKLLIPDEPESPLSRRQTVTVTEPFSTPTIRVRPSDNFTEGEVLDVACTVQKSDRSSEEVTITLQKGKQILKSTISGSMTFSQVATVSDTGNYTCKAEGKTASKTTSAMVNVKELFPRPRLTLKPANKTEYINDGDLVSLECSVSSLSYQESSKMDFYYRFTNGERRNMRRGGKYQTYMRATDSGVYTCEVTIANITKTSEPVLVKVYAAVAKPELKQHVKGNKMVVLGETLTLTCRSPIGTPPIVYTLYREGEVIGRNEMRDNREAVFLVNTTKQNDLGKYQCQAANRNQKLTAFSDALNVSVIAPVREVGFFIIQENGEVEEGAELSLVCKAQNGTLPITFSFYVKKGKDILLTNMTIMDNMHAQHTIPLFTKQNDGSYFCTASNKANMSVRSRTLEVKAVLARWKKGVIGAFVFFIILAAICIGLYLYLDKKKKGKKITTNSSRSSVVANASSEKSAVDMKTDDSYFGSVQNEEELHILKTTDENTGNNQQNHEVEYTEVDGSAPEPNHDSVENNYVETPETNNLS